MRRAPCPRLARHQIKLEAPMTLDEWRTAVREQASRLREKLTSLARHTGEMAPGLIYGATAGLAVLPLVVAARGGAVPYAELADLLGGMGVNLLSSELYAWRERSQAQLDAELPKKLGQLGQENTGWRDLLDKLIQAAQADAAVQTALGEAAAPYLTALQQDAARLGSSLVIANNKYVVLNGDLTVHETHIHIEKIVAFYRRPDESLDEADLAAQVRQYLTWILERYGKIVMRGVSYRGSNVIDLELDQVYVPLQAQTRSAGAQQADIRLDQLLPLATQLIVTGGPGSGKTTVLQHIAWSLAMALTRDPDIARQKLGLSAADSATSNLPLPIYLPLSRYHSYRRELREKSKVDEPHKVTLYSFLSHFLIERGIHLPRDFFVRLLEKEQALILLLDGL
ncbi:MAG: hypothetical protein ACKO4U_15975, partial [Caldilinea sp.]